MVILSAAFHPQMDGQSECTIQTLEDMLRYCIIDFKGNWDKHLPWWSLLIIIVFIHPFPCLPMKPCMVGGVGLILDCLKLASLRFLVPI